MKRLTTTTPTTTLGECFGRLLTPVTPQFAGSVDWRWETSVEEWRIILSDWVNASSNSASKKYMAVMAYLRSMLVFTVSATQQFEIFAAASTVLEIIMEQCCYYDISNT